MTDLRTAAQMALDALECMYTPPNVRSALETLRAALAQGEQEPVAWKYETPAYVSLQWKQRGDWRDGTWTALYTVPPQRPWQGLTDEEIKEALVFNRRIMAAHIEAKLKEKNT